MGFVDLFRRPKWKHSNAEVRATAVRELSPDQTDVLQGIAQDDKDAGVRRVAIKKLEDPTILTLIAERDPDESLRQIASEKASTLLIGAATSEQDEQTCREALDQITDQRALAEVAKTAAQREIRMAAVERLTDEKALADVARGAREPQVRLETLRKVVDVATLRSIALNDERKEVCLAALERLEDREGLEAVARKARNKTVRTHARRQLAALGARPAATKKQQSRWLQLCEMVEVLSRSTDWERTGVKIEQAQVEWDGMGQADAELQGRFQQAVSAFFARFAEHKERFAERERQERELQLVLAQRIALCEEAESLRGDDVSEQVQQIRQRWEQLGPIPPSHREVIEQRFAKACDECLTRHKRVVEAQELHARLEKLCDEAARLLGAPKAGRALKRYQELKSEWNRHDAPPAELRQRFEGVGQQLDLMQQEAQQSREQDKQENLNGMQRLCERMEAATGSDKLKNAERLLKDAQFAFKRLGDLPSKEDRDAVSGRYHAAREKLFTRVQELREADEWKRWSVVPKLEELCARVEALAKEENLKRVSQELRRAQAAWKKVGPAPRDKAEALWQRFKQASDEAYAKCQEYFGQLETQREGNLQQKLALCEEVERLAAVEPVDTAGWEQTANQIKEIQGRWKKIGPVPRAQSDAVWARFRKPCDAFFDQRQEHLEQASGERDKNLAQKEALCEEVERLAAGELVDRERWEETANEIKGLQVRWKKIGPVPRAQSDAVWARFRQACDQFFDRRQQQVEQERVDNQVRKEALCDQLEALLAEEAADPAELCRQVLQIRVEWKEIGSVPQVAVEALWGRFAVACERAVVAHDEHFRGTEMDPTSNEKKRERLCQRVEELVLLHAPLAAAESGSVEQMAEALRAALAQNALRETMASEPDLQASIREVKRLQGQWRKVGPVPGEVGQALAERFRLACDRLFELRPPQPENKAPAKGQQPAEEDGNDENLRAKEALCEKAEALATGDDLAQHQDAIRELRRQWKAIGLVPKSKARRLWNRFRRACNRVMSEAKRAAEEPAQAQDAAIKKESTLTGWDAALDSGWDDVLEETPEEEA